MIYNLFKLADKFQKKYATENVAPENLSNWNRQQIIELQNLLNKAPIENPFAEQPADLVPDGIYGALTKARLNEVMNQNNETNPSNLVIKLRGSSSIRLDPKKQLINAVGMVVPNGPEVKNVQDKLKQEKFLLTSDGIWGPNSYLALINYQKKYNLPIEGKLNEETVLIMRL